MRLVPVWTMLPLILLAACQSSSQTPALRTSAASHTSAARQCSPRLADAGQCNPSIYVFPELTNVR